MMSLTLVYHNVDTSVSVVDMQQFTGHCPDKNSLHVKISTSYSHLALYKNEPFSLLVKAYHLCKYFCSVKSVSIKYIYIQQQPIMIVFLGVKPNTN